MSKPTPSKYINYLPSKFEISLQITRALLATYQTQTYRTRGICGRQSCRVIY